jgi:hypothetical protein
VVHFDDVQVEEKDGVYQVSGTLVQDSATFHFPLEMTLETIDENQHLHFEAFAARMPFHFVSQSKPLRLVLDPQETAPIARRAELHIREGIQPADGVIVYGASGTADDTAANMAAAKAMHARLLTYKHLDLPVKSDKELTEGDRLHSLLLFGNPSTNALAAEFTSQFPVRFMEGKALWWQGRTFRRPDSGTVEIIPNPLAPDHTVVLFASVAANGMKETLNYTQQNNTFCLFEDGQVIEAGETLDTFPELQAVLY